MVRKRQIMAFFPSTNYNSLVCVTTVRNIDPITLCAHRNLLIAVAIGSDLRFAGSTLNFHIFCLRFGPPIIPRIPHSGVLSITTAIRRFLCAHKVMGCIFLTVVTQTREF